MRITLLPTVWKIALATSFLLLLSLFLFSEFGPSGEAKENDKLPTSSTHRRRSVTTKVTRSEGKARDSSEVLRAVLEKNIVHEDAWDELKQIDCSPARKVGYQRFIIRDLARNKGAIAALNFLNSKVGPGTQRLTLLDGVFANACNNLDESLQALSLLEFPEEELEAAIEGIGSSYITNDRSGFDMNLVINKAPLQVVPSIASSAIFSLGRQDDRDLTSRQNEAINIYNSSAKALADSPNKNLELEKVYSSLIADFPMAAWKLLSDSSNDTPKHITASERGLIPAMVAYDPKIAMNEITSFRGGKRNEYAEKAAYHIAKRNMAEVTDIMTSVPGLQQADVRDSFVMGIVKYAAGSGEYNTAKEWIETIRDPRLKLKAEKLLDR